MRTKLVIDCPKCGHRFRVGEGKPAEFTPPTKVEVEGYVGRKGFLMDASNFVGYYSSKGWKVGKTPMKSWKLAAIRWCNVSLSRGARDVQRCAVTRGRGVNIGFQSA